MRCADEVYAILGACFEVYKRMGCGFLEAVYFEREEYSPRNTRNTRKMRIEARYIATGEISCLNFRVISRGSWAEVLFLYESPKIGYSYRIYPRRAKMRQHLTISKKGQVTLPAELRKKMGLEAGGTVIAEEKNGELILRPAAVVEIDLYTDEQIDGWDEEDRLDAQTRDMILNKLSEKA
jgi:AbrB family looped-hinge helix DNA binding protein